tara:strand:+ start:38038 stop:38478 length:441 start_codon:yes stop_codon:yes gene_type:complete
LTKYIYILILFKSINLNAQKQIKWDIGFKKNENLIVFKATILDGWHLYAAYLPNPNQGPLPTLFTFNKSKKFILKDSIVQQPPIIEYDKNFGVELAFYEKKSIFFQKIEAFKKKIKISGNINYMTCNETMCIPYDLPFEIKINQQD